MKKRIFPQLLLALSLVLAQVIYAAEKNNDNRIDPHSLANRSQVFETYYLNNPANNDRSIFKHMGKWHKDDFQAITRTVSLSETQTKLRIIHDAIEKAFEDGTVSHSKIAAAYLAYSIIISSKSEMALQGNTEDARDEISVDDTILQVKQYIETNTLPCTVEASTIYPIVLNEKYNLRWLPYVSRKGLSTFRILNRQFGMKAPIIGLPLERSSYDGNLNMPPCKFCNHDPYHGGFYATNYAADAGSSEIVNFIYDCYRKADEIVSQLTNPRIQALCDFFLYEVGHEKGFKVFVNWDYGKDSYKLTSNIEHPKDLNEACDKVLEKLKDDIHQFFQPSPLYKWEWEKERTAILLPFINPAREGQQLFTLMELINNLKLDKGRPLSKKEITYPICPGYLTTLPPQPFNAFEMWCMSPLNLNFYNELFDYKRFFNNNGIDFDIWKGDEFQGDAIISVFKEACETFKREVATGFTGFDCLQELVNNQQK